jgi:hypothetical protein
VQAWWAVIECRIQPLSGPHHWCGVHSLRDIDTWKKNDPQNESLLLWATQVKAVSDDAMAWVALEPDPHLSARKQHQVFAQQLWALCQPCVHTQAFQHTMCERRERVLPEVCVFVAVPGVPAHTTLAERSIRPLVIARTINGGSRFLGAARSA